MPILFKNIYIFSVLFFTLLVIDIYIKLNFESFPLRYISKSLLMILIIAFYIINNQESSKMKFRFMLSALAFFFIGDIFMILYESQLIYIIGIFCFILGKTFYVFRFSNQRDFNLLRLLPFLVMCFIYMSVLLSLTYDNLKAFFYPVLIYLFIAMIVILFALLRKNEVSAKSYYLVLVGVFFSALSDSITVLQTFYNENIAYHSITIMLFYGLSQYFIVRGIVTETNDKLEAVAN